MAFFMRFSRIERLSEIMPPLVGTAHLLLGLVKSLPVNIVEKIRPGLQQARPQPMKIKGIVNIEFQF